MYYVFGMNVSVEKNVSQMLKREKRMEEINIQYYLLISSWFRSEDVAEKKDARKQVPTNQ